MVSDDSLARLGVERLLGEQNRFAVVKQSNSTDEALADVKTVLPDLTVLSVSLKNGMGLEFISRMKLANTTQRMLVFSYYEDAIYAGLALNAGAFGYISKSAPVNEILYGLCELAEGRMYVSPNIAQKMLCEVAGANGEGVPNPMRMLSQREFAIFEMVGRGEPTRRIARKLEVSVHTVETYRERIRAKLRITNSAELNFQAIVWVLLN